MKKQFFLNLLDSFTSLFSKKIIIAENGQHLKELVIKERRLHGETCDLNHIDVSRVTSMKDLFFFSQFNGNISKWDVSNVITMSEMFHMAFFRKDIAEWKPYALEKADLNLDRKIPYWLKYENKEDRNRAINHHQLNKELNNDSIVNKTPAKKIKI